MGRKKIVKLISERDKKTYLFQSYTNASTFLGRSHVYLQRCKEDGTVPKHARTGETFRVEVMDVLQESDEKRLKEIVHNKRPVMQLCNSCARAGGHCSWSNNLTPIKGWDAEPAFDTSGNFYTWQIKKCPLYMKDGSTVEERREQRRLLSYG